MAAMASTGNSHMDAATQALCFFYRNPPPSSGVAPQPFKEIPKLVGKPHMGISRVEMAAKRFLRKKAKRGRKPGWRKTTGVEDKAIMTSFNKVRQPLGCLVEARDVWNGAHAETPPENLHANCGKSLERQGIHNAREGGWG